MIYDLRFTIYELNGPGCALWNVQGLLGSQSA
jgi:hypothetical protein